MRLVRRARLGTRVIAGMAIAALVVAGLLAVRPKGGEIDRSVGDCPPVLWGQSSASTDYFDLFMWRGVQYIVDDAPRSDQHGRQVTTVGCSVADISAGNQVGRGPWPDRTASFAHAGSPVYATILNHPECELVIPVDGQARFYIAVDVTSDNLDPLCEREDLVSNPAAYQVHRDSGYEPMPAPEPWRVTPSQPIE